MRPALARHCSFVTDDTLAFDTFQNHLAAFFSGACHHDVKDMFMNTLSRCRWWQFVFGHFLVFSALMVSLSAQALTPTVTSISPAVGPTAGGQLVAINGSGFTGATSITIGGAVCARTSSSPPDDGFLFCTTGARAAGAVSVQVTTPNGTNVANTLYTYDGATPSPSAPTITAISPTTGPTTGGQPVTINGTGFTGAIGVTIGGVTCTSFTVISDSVISCTTGAHAAGVAHVEVTTPAGTNATNMLYTYSAEVSDIQAIPTLSEWGMIALMVLISFIVLRRRSQF